jgi:hypothetical protein
MSTWNTDNSANRLNKTYLQGFVDVSGGDVSILHGDISCNGNLRIAGDASFSSLPMLSSTLTVGSNLQLATKAYVSTASSSGGGGGSSTLDNALTSYSSSVQYSDTSFHQFPPVVMELDPVDITAQEIAWASQYSTAASSGKFIKTMSGLPYGNGTYKVFVPNWNMIGSGSNVFQLENSNSYNNGKAWIFNKEPFDDDALANMTSSTYPGEWWYGAIRSTALTADTEAMVIEYPELFKLRSIIVRGHDTTNKNLEYGITVQVSTDGITWSSPTVVNSGSGYGQYTNGILYWYCNGIETKYLKITVKAPPAGVTYYATFAELFVAGHRRIFPANSTVNDLSLGNSFTVTSDVSYSGVIDISGNTSTTNKVNVATLDISYNNQQKGENYPFFTVNLPGTGKEVKRYLTSDSNTTWDVSNSYVEYYKGMNVAFTKNVTLNYDIGTTSDDRLKFNEQYIENATETLLKLNPQLYDQIALFDTMKTTKHAGLIAQEVYYNAPELRHLVTGTDGLAIQDTSLNVADPNSDPDYESLGWKNLVGLQYTQLIPYIIKSNQELHAQIKQQETSMSSLVNEITNMKNELSALENP